MSTKPLMLDGLVKTGRSPNEDAMRELRRENDRLEQELRVVRAQLAEAVAEKTKLARSIEMLRRQLGPLHHALRAVFGEIEIAIGDEEWTAAPSPNTVRSSDGSSDPRWQSFKNTFPGAPARVIDALLSHDEMTITQLSTVLKAHYSTVKDALAKLRKAGAVVVDNGKHRLAR